MSLSAAVCFLACHGGPADHFATFTEQLPIGMVKVCASGPALKKFQDRGIEVAVPFSLDALSPEEEDALAKQIAKTCSQAKIVITDVGHAFDSKVQKALAHQAPHIFRFAYYDNPDPYVPGGYSTVAAEVMQAAQAVLFANSTLSQAPIFKTPEQEIDLGNQEKIGIGYYPIHYAQKIVSRRILEKSQLRKALFQQYELVDKGQQVLVYFGGNNDEYFLKAFPAFLSFLEQGMMKNHFQNLVVILQQHPGAKANNMDSDRMKIWQSQHGQHLQAPVLLLSDFHSDNAQTIADVASYYQTSMGPQFVLAGIPTIQIGHETYEDILVRNQLISSATSVDQLIDFLERLKVQSEENNPDVLFERLGIHANWLKNLEDTITGRL